MELAERQAIGDDSLSPWMRVWQDMGRLQQLHMPQPAERAALRVGSQDPLTEGVLVKSEREPLRQPRSRGDTRARACS